MNKLKKSLELLDKFFSENSREYIEEKLNRIDNMDIAGETLESYLQNFSENYDYESKIESVLSNIDEMDQFFPETEEWDKNEYMTESETFKINNMHEKDYYANIDSDFTGTDDDYKIAA